MGSLDRGAAGRVGRAGGQGSRPSCPRPTEEKILRPGMSPDLLGGGGRVRVGWKNEGPSSGLHPTFLLGGLSPSCFLGFMTPILAAPNPEGTRPQRTVDRKPGS